MRFPNPVAVTCLTCGRPTVLAETLHGAVRVHCGTWRWQCETPANRNNEEDAVPADLTALDTQELVF
ncbi:MAG: hypothetical protein ACRDRU_25705 [Pseudonocardiaceae bacterium]